MSIRVTACFLLTALFGCTREPEIIIVPVSTSAEAVQAVEVEEVETAAVAESLHPGALRDRIMEVGVRTPTRGSAETPEAGREVVESQHPLADREPASRRVGEKPTRRKNQILK